MQSEDLAKYHEISAKFKELIDAVTTLDLSQLKLFFVNLEKKIIGKTEAFYNEFDTMKNYLDNIKQAKGKVAIHFASARGNVDIIRYMTENLKLDISIKDKEGNNAFFTAVEHGHLQLIRYFIEEANCSPNQTKEGQISSLHIASNQNHVDIISYLIGKGADIEKVSIYGKPINWAVGAKNYQATKVLLDHGADANGDSTASSLSPLILSVDYQLPQIYRLLIQKGANVNSKDPNGFSVLHVAAQKGEVEFVKDLIDRGAQLNIQVQGKTPLYLAFENNRWAVVNLLKEKETNFSEIEERVKASQSAKKVVQPDKQKAEEIKLIGNKLYSQKKYEQALSQYNEAIQYDLQNEVIHRNIAACCLALKKFQQALLHCHHAKKVDNKNVKTCYRQAQAYIGLGNYIDASASLWECCLIEPHNKNFRAQFQKLVEEGKKRHAQSHIAK